MNFGEREGSGYTRVEYHLATSPLEDEELTRQSDWLVMYICRALSLFDDFMPNLLSVSNFTISPSLSND